MKDLQDIKSKRWSEKYSVFAYLALAFMLASGLFFLTFVFTFLTASDNWKKYDFFELTRYLRTINLLVVNYMPSYFTFRSKLPTWWAKRPPSVCCHWRRTEARRWAARCRWRGCVTSHYVRKVGTKRPEKSKEEAAEIRKHVPNKLWCKVLMQFVKKNFIYTYKIYL